MRAILTDAALLISGSFAASLLVKVTLTLGVALVAHWLTWRNRAAVRHVLLSAAFVVLLALPVAALFPSRAVALRPAEPSRKPAAVVLYATTIYSFSVPSTAAFTDWVISLTSIVIVLICVGAMRVGRPALAPWSRGTSVN